MNLTGKKKLIIVMNTLIPTVLLFGCVGQWKGILNKYDINYPVCLGFLYGDLDCITARL